MCVFCAEERGNGVEMVFVYMIVGFCLRVRPKLTLQFAAPPPPPPPNYTHVCVCVCVCVELLMYAYMYVIHTYVPLVFSDCWFAISS